MGNKHCFVLLSYGEPVFIENCLISLLNQRVKSDVFIATSTPNSYITNIASKFNIEILVTPKTGMGIGYNYDFALYAKKQYDLITIAHDDDYYEENYSLEILEAYKKNPNALIIFSDYSEIKKEKIVSTGINLIVKRILLFPLRFRTLKNKLFVKRLVISFGDPISCPAITYVSSKISGPIFYKHPELNSAVDWSGLEVISNFLGDFVFVNKKLMRHRIHEQSTTSKTIRNNQRTLEELIILKRFWPSHFAKIIHFFYQFSQVSNWR